MGLNFLYGSAAPRLVEVVIDADWIVDAWAMPADELDAYAVDGDFDYYEARRMRQGAIRFTPDGGREWVLVLSNPNGFDVHVHYDVILVVRRPSTSGSKLAASTLGS